MPAGIKQVKVPTDLVVGDSDHESLACDEAEGYAGSASLRCEDAAHDSKVEHSCTNSMRLKISKHTPRALLRDTIIFHNIVRLLLLNYPK